MSQLNSEIKIQASLTRIHHSMAAGGEGFNEYILTITNTGSGLIQTAGLVMRITFRDRPDDSYILRFPEGISQIGRQGSIDFTSLPGRIPHSGSAAVTLLREGNNEELTQAPVVVRTQ